MNTDYEKKKDLILNIKKPSNSEQIVTELKQLRTLTETWTQQIWLNYLALLKEVLRKPLADDKYCYRESSRLLSSFTRSNEFSDIIQEKSIARENIFICITGLSYPHFKNFLILTDDEQTSSDNSSYYSHARGLLRIASQSVFYAQFLSNDDRKYFEDAIDLFALLVDRVDRSVSKTTHKNEQKDISLGDLNARILSLLWNIADKTVLVPILLKCGLGKKVIGWLSQACRLDKKNRRPIISIIHNLARHDDGTDELNSYQAIDVIKQYQKNNAEAADSEILVTSMALALLSTPEQLKTDNKRMNNVMNRLLQLVMNASKNNEYRHGGFHVSEPLAVMVKLFVVDELTIDYILCHAETEPPSDLASTINMFISLLFDFSHAMKGISRLDQFTLIAILNILWSISFQKDYAAVLMKEERLTLKLKEIITGNENEEGFDQYKPRSMEGARKATNGILHNLKQDLPIKRTYSTPVVPNPITKMPRRMSIMISYCHDNNSICDTIYNFLSNCNDIFEIWIDRTHCRGAGDIWEQIAEGMEQANVILCLISSQYFESKSCRKEFVYATDTIKKPIIPVLLERFTPRGWLGIRMSGVRYIRFQDILNPNETKMLELLDIILSNSPAPTISTTVDHVLPSHTDIGPLEAGSRSEVNQPAPGNSEITAWFADNRISDKIRDMFRFETHEQMLNYAELITLDDEKQMTLYTKIYAEKYNGRQMPPHEFHHFAKSLKQLHKQKCASQH